MTSSGRSGTCNRTGASPTTVTTSRIGRSAQPDTRSCPARSPSASSVPNPRTGRESSRGTGIPPRRRSMCLAGGCEAATRAGRGGFVITGTGRTASTTQATSGAALAPGTRGTGGTAQPPPPAPPRATSPGRNTGKSTALGFTAASSPAPHDAPWHTPAPSFASPFLRWR
jgi:hypothetical protein